MNKQERTNQWIDKAIKGKKNFQLLACRKDGIFYQFEDQQSPVTSLAICVWDKSQVYLQHILDDETPVDTSKRFFAVVKNGEGLKVAVENVGLFSFGEENDNDDDCKAVIFVQCECLSTLVTAANNPPMFWVQDYVQDKSDPLSVILPDLFSHLLAHYERKEADDNAGEIGSKANVNLGG